MEQEVDRWITWKGKRLPVNKQGKIISLKQKQEELSSEYKNKLLYPIGSIKVKNYDTGDTKTGKYHYEYHAKTKDKVDIFTYSLEELERKLKDK